MRKPLPLFCVLLAVCLLSALGDWRSPAWAQLGIDAEEAGATVKASEEGRYRVQPGDVIAVNVFQLNLEGVVNPQEARVDAAGEVRLQVIGNLPVEGSTLAQIEELVDQALDRNGILRDANVRVDLVEQGLGTFSIILDPSLSAAKLGRYPLPMPPLELTVQEAVAIGGGVSGDVKEVRVLSRGDKEGAVGTDYEVQRLLRGEVRPKVEPGDVIVVLPPRRESNIGAGDGG